MSDLISRLAAIGVIVDPASAGALARVYAWGEYPLPSAVHAAMGAWFNEAPDDVLRELLGVRDHARQ
jgi:hypothetical protein